MNFFVAGSAWHVVRLCCCLLFVGLPPSAFGQDVAPATARVTVLHSFGPPVGAELDDTRIPYAPLLLASDGMLYGLGSAGPSTSSRGALYRCDLDGGNYELTLHFDDTDGRIPQSGLLEGTDGKLYGTAPFGNSAGKFGMVFSVEKNGSGYTTLHSFTNTPDGANPSAGLIEGPQGFLYGVTEKGGTNQVGTVFRITKDGSVHQVLYHFRSTGADGKRPFHSLILGDNGRLYGTTFSGGAMEGGTVFSVLPDGSDYHQLHSFGSTSLDGLSPSGPLLELGGFLYGTTSVGGQRGHGTVYRLRTDGTAYETLHRFQGPPLDGHSPYGRLVQGFDGQLYGTTLQGGAADVGTVYQWRVEDASYALAWSFARSIVQGQLPQSGLIQGPAGELYGTTTGGGGFGSGTVYQFNPPVSISAQLRGAEWILEWPANGLNYQVMAADSLVGPDNWLDVGATVELNGHVHRARFPSTLTSRFFRLQFSE